jgi:hypothetical protein
VLMGTVGAALFPWWQEYDPMNAPERTRIATPMVPAGAVDNARWKTPKNGAGAASSARAQGNGCPPRRGQPKRRIFVTARVGRDRKPVWERTEVYDSKT